MNTLKMIYQFGFNVIITYIGLQEIVGTFIEPTVILTFIL